MSDLDHVESASPSAPSWRRCQWLPAIVIALGAVACGSETPTEPTEPTPLPPVDCTPSLSASPNPVPSPGGTVQLEVTIASGCTWVASEDVSWLVDLAPTTGQGSGRVSVQAHSNIQLSPREGAVTVNGVSLVVRQDPMRLPPCLYGINPLAAVALATGSTIRVQVSWTEFCGDGGWSAHSEAAWLSIRIPLDGPYPTRVDVTVAPNTGDARTGIVRIAGLAFTVVQGAAGAPLCTYGITPTAQSVPAGGGAFAIQVTTGAECAWTAVKETSAYWISGVEPALSAGNGTVTFTVPANITGLTRQGSLKVADQTVSVTQTP